MRSPGRWLGGRSLGLTLIMRPVSLGRGQLARSSSVVGWETGHQTQLDVTRVVGASPSARCLPASLTLLPPAVMAPWSSGRQVAQRLGSQGCWSRTMAEAILFARWAMAMVMIPPGLPR